MRSALLLLATAFALSAAHPAAAEDAPRLLAQTSHSLVLGEPRAEALAAQVAEAIEEAAPRIAPLTGTQDLSPVRAYVYPDRDSFRQAARLPRRSTTVGLAVFPDEIIHIDGTGLLASIDKVVPHEVAHVMVSRSLGSALQRLPRWANEGIAEYLAGARASQVDPVSLRAVSRGRALALADLDAAIASGGENAGIAYAQSASLVNFLVAERGESVIADILSALRETRDFDSALHRTTGFHLPELEASWRASVAHHWRWLLLLQSGAPLLALMVLLFFVGLARHIIRRRRRQEISRQDW